MTRKLLSRKKRSWQERKELTMQHNEAYMTPQQHAGHIYAWLQQARAVHVALTGAHLRSQSASPL